jgi:hypothetical protein
MGFFRGPNIVRNGLVLALDAANPKSYTDGSTIWNDLSGNRNSGSLNNAPALNNDSYGSLVFNSEVSNSVSIPRIVQDDFTLSCWFKTSQSSSFSGFPQWYGGIGLIDGEVAGTANDFGLSIGSGKVLFGVGNPDTTITSSLTYNDNRWHQATATRIKSTGVIILYIDGVQVASAIGGTNSLTAATSLRIGSIQTDIQFFSGSIASVQIYNQALSAREVAQNYNAIQSRFQYPFANILTYLTLNQAAGLSIYYNIIESTPYLTTYSSYPSASAFALVNDPIL